MTPRQEDDFRSRFLERLLKKKDELRRAISELRANRKTYEGEASAGDFMDEVDGAQREISAQQSNRLLERKSRELGVLDRLLERIEKEEDFGICEECGERIPQERLLVIPEATLCVACQRQEEKRERALGAPSGDYWGTKAPDWDADDGTGDDAPSPETSGDGLSVRDETGGDSDALGEES